MNQGKGIFRIGTSGIVVPGSKETFPLQFQDKSRLHYYSTLLNTLEVNSTFKKIPMPWTLKKWSLDVPDDFEFTIKFWKEITHVKQLNIDLQHINTFVNIVNNIGAKKGCLLIQFPGSITAEYRKQVAQILNVISTVDDENNWRKAVEFRSVSWYNNETYKLLDSLHASMVLHDMPKSKNLEPRGTPAFIYYRFHGPKGDYGGSYTGAFLFEQAVHIRSLLKQGKDVYAYFNNTMGDACENAMYLKALVEK